MGNQQMDVVGDRSGSKQGAFLIFDNSANVRVKFIPDIIVQTRLPVLRREDQMHEDLSERLRHELRPLQGLGTFGNLSQGVALGFRMMPPLGLGNQH